VTSRDEPGHRPRVLAMLHLPPPVHGASIMAGQLAGGRIAEAVRLKVIPLRFARGLSDLGRPSARKLAIAAVYALRQVAAMTVGRPAAGYIAASTRGGPMLRDALYIRLFRLWRVPCAVHVHTMGLAESLRAARPAVRWWVGGALRGATRVIALNQAHAGELAGVVGNGPVVVVPNGIPDLPAADAVSVGGEVEPDSCRGRVLFLSNISEEKGALDLLEALPAIRATQPGVRPTFAGAWPDPVFRDRFDNRARELGVEDWIDVPGPVDAARKQDLLAGAAVFVFPSYYVQECAPLVVIEAMRHALPIVATRHAGIPELLDDAGVLVPPRDPSEVAQQVLKLLGDPARARGLGRSARTRFERHYRLDHWERAMMGVLLATATSRTRQ